MNRSQRVRLNNNVSNSLNVRRGVPQGCVLRALLFCMYINDLPDVSTNGKVHMYAEGV